MFGPRHARILDVLAHLPLKLCRTSRQSCSLAETCTGVGIQTARETRLENFAGGTVNPLIARHYPHDTRGGAVAHFLTKRSIFLRWIGALFNQRMATRLSHLCL